MTDLTPRTYGRFNGLGFYILYKKEVHRFTNIITQTVFGPVITSLLFLAIFQLSIGKINITIGNLTFSQFLIPGLIVMNIIQNAFSNTSSSIVSSKMTGSIVDLIMPPLSAIEILGAMTLAGITRGLLIGLVSGIAIWIFSDIYIYSVIWTIIFAILGASMMAMIGVLGGIWSEKWDNIASVTTYIITPLSFLSGTFYSIDRLHPTLQSIAQLNPFFYMIDGFRYGMTGYGDSNPLVGLAVLSGLNFLIATITLKVLQSGWRLRT